MPRDRTNITLRLVVGEVAVDALGALLNAPRTAGAFVIRTEVCAPWALRVEDRAPLTLAVVVRGQAPLGVDGRPPVRLAPGDTALVRGPSPYRVGDEDGTHAQAVIGPGQVCTKPDGSPLSDFRSLGLLAWSNVPDGAAAAAVLLTATWVQDQHVSRRLLALLPPLLVVPAGEADPRLRALVDLLLAETTGTDAGQDAVVDRLVDLVLAALLRGWLARSTEAPSWSRMHADPVVGAALRRLHHEPHRPWTVQSLAADVGVSRATLARRFTTEVGEPPMAYLARWRLDVAADLLTSTDLTLAAVAHRVGYASAFSLSGAFSRARGHAPTALRR